MHFWPDVWLRGTQVDSHGLKSGSILSISETLLMLWTLLLIILVMWALGLGFGIAGNLVHILLVVAVVVLLLQLLQGRRVG
jgi:hypothetical protein